MRDPLIQSALAEWRAMSPRERFMEAAGAVAAFGLPLLLLYVFAGGGR